MMCRMRTPCRFALLLGSFLLSGLLWGCGQAKEEGEDAACDPMQGPCSFTHDFGETALAPGAEIDGQCNSWTLNNPTDLWVSEVVMENDGAHHHSNWFFVPDHIYTQPDGKWDCDAGHFAELNAALLGGVLFAQSTQARSEVQALPKGAVVRVPAYARVIGSVHLLNPSAAALRTGLRMTLRTVPAQQAAVKLSPMRFSYYDLHLPPGRTSEFSGRCDIRGEFLRTRKVPYSMKLYYVLPHYHDLGRSFRVRIAGGERDGEEIFHLRGGYGEPGGKAFMEPIDLSRSDGLEVTCGFENTRDKEVRWGIGEQEMCVMLGFVESRVALDASVEKGKIVEDIQGGMQRQSGPCGVAMFDFDAG